MSVLIVSVSEFRSLDNCMIIPVDILVREILSMDFISDNPSAMERVCFQLTTIRFLDSIDVENHEMYKIIGNILRRAHDHFFVEMIEKGYDVKKPYLISIDGDNMVIGYD